ncbi:MAG TPA: ECF-type sigma factor [Gemmataceae bacterium]
MSDVTRLLDAAATGDPHAAAELLPLVYDELRKHAAAKLAHEKPGQTLATDGRWGDDRQRAGPVSVRREA